MRTSPLALAPVHPGTLLTWVRAEAADGKGGLVDGFAKRGNRKSRFGAEENTLLMAEVRKSYLNANRPPVTTTVADVRVADPQTAVLFANSSSIDQVGRPRAARC